MFSDIRSFLSQSKSWTEYSGCVEKPHTTSTMYLHMTWMQRFQHTVDHFGVIDGLVSSWSENISVFSIYGHQDTDWLCDAPSVL